MHLFRSLVALALRTPYLEIKTETENLVELSVPFSTSYLQAISLLSSPQDKSSHLQQFKNRNATGCPAA